MTVTRGAPTRPYRSELRRQQAAETRRRVVEAALELFSRQGFRSTTFAQIADRAGVAVQTVQKHGSKTALLQAAVELASFGVEGESNVFETDVGRSLLTADDPDSFAAAVGDAMLVINEPAADVWMAFVGAAHGDEELRGHHLRMLGLIRDQVARFLRYTADRGWLRQDVPFDALVEAFCVITSVESYARFVLLDGKDKDEYRAFVARTLRASVMVP